MNRPTRPSTRPPGYVEDFFDDPPEDESFDDELEEDEDEEDEEEESDVAAGDSAGFADFSPEEAFTLASLASAPCSADSFSSRLRFLVP